MAWTYLIIAGLFEIVWAYFMKQSDGFTRLWPSVATLAFIVGVVFLQEHLSLWRVLAALLIVGGIVLMRLAPAR